jgi:hypothetical protein
MRLLTLKKQFMIELIPNLLAVTSSDSNQLNHFGVLIVPLKSQLHADKSAAVLQLETLRLSKLDTCA